MGRGQRSSGIQHGRSGCANGIGAVQQSRLRCGCGVWVAYDNECDARILPRHEADDSVVREEIRRHVADLRWTAVQQGMG